ncbi:MAG: TolC family outer membrane protein [Gammaproteobacteria bacterium]
MLTTFDQAVEKDPRLKKSLANLYSVNENKPQSIAKLLPSLSIAGTSSRDRIFNKKGGFRGAGEQSFWSHALTLNLTQPVFHWDYWVQLSQSDDRIAQAEAEYLAEQQNLMTRIVETYFNVLSAEDNLEFSTAEKQAIARQLDQAKKRFEVGLIAITDVYEAQAGFDRSRADEVAAYNELDNAKEALREIIGESEAILDKLGLKLPLSRPDPENISEWTTAALKQNLFILSAQHQADFARKEIERQTTGHFPQLDIVGSASLQDQNSSFGLRGDTESIGIQLNIPLFEGGAVNSRIRQAAQDFEQAKEDLIASKRSIKRQVRDAYRGVISSISRVEALEATVKSAESALEATEAGFEVGTRTMVDVLVEQRNLYRAKRDFSRSRYDYLINGIKLKQSASNLTRDDLEAINRLLL